MSAEIIFVVIIVIVVLNFLFERILSFLNIRHLDPKLPAEAEGIYTPEKYAQSQQYLKRKARFSIITSSFSVILILLMLFLNGFAFTDQLVRSFTTHPILQPLLFFAILGLAFDIISIPFELYSIFKIEEEFGFNRMRPFTYITDKLKSWLLGAIIGGGLLSAVMWIYLETGKWFVVIAFAVMALFGIFMSMFYTQLIVPLFNKLKPLPEGELKAAIEEFGKKAGFPLSKISMIDSSKRSTKSNAYFSGLGRKKRIVLFDTLIEKHTTEELVAVLAHEIGHYKKKHIQKGLFTGLLQTSVLLFIFYVFLGYPVFQEAIGAVLPSFHMGLVVFGMLYSPVSLMTGLFDNIVSRKNEYTADAFAAQNELGVPLSEALKKLSSDNLTNLTPHPLYVFFHYSHPPLLERLNALQIDR
jgi:STE24 endopeptidase